MRTTCDDADEDDMLVGDGVALYSVCTALPDALRMCVLQNFKGSF
jgi:hypothetical protein